MRHGRRGGKTANQLQAKLLCIFFVYGNNGSITATPLADEPARGYDVLGQCQRHPGSGVYLLTGREYQAFAAWLAVAALATGAIPVCRRKDSWACQILEKFRPTAWAEGRNMELRRIAQRHMKNREGMGMSIIYANSKISISQLYLYIIW